MVSKGKPRPGVCYSSKQAERGQDNFHIAKGNAVGITQEVLWAVFVLIRNLLCARGLGHWGWESGKGKSPQCCTIGTLGILPDVWASEK